MDQRVASYESWEDLRWYCVHSADPVGHLVLGLLRRSREADLVDASDQRLHGAPARQLPAGRAARSRSRADLPSCRGPEAVRGRAARRPEPGAPRAARVRGGARPRAARFGRGAPGADRRPDRARGRALREGRARRARGARARGLGHLHGAAEARRGPGSRGRRSGDDDRGGVRRGRTAHAAAGAQLRLRDHGAAAAEAARDRGDLRLRAPRGRHRRRRAPRRREARPAGGAARAPRRAARRRLRARRARRRARALPDPRRGPALRSWTAACRISRSTRYASFEDLRGYCRLVAGAVGVACLPVYGGGDPELAETLGVALQLINIIRDVAEDWSLGRVYLPTEELEAFGVAEEEIGAGLLTPQLQALLGFQAARARVYLEDGLHLLDQLDRRSALCVGAFAGLYRATLERIEASGYDVFAGPPHLSPFEKLRIVGGGLWR